MGVAKQTRKFAVCLDPLKSQPSPASSSLTKLALDQQTKRVIGKRDARLKENKDKADIVQQTKKKATANGELSTSLPKRPSFGTLPGC